MNKHPGRTGRPPFKPTAEQRRQVETMAGYGIPHRDIAMLVTNPQTDEPVDVTTLEKAFAKQLREGAVKANTTMVGKLYKNGVDSNNVAAQIWWTKCRLGWKEPAQTIAHQGVEGAPPIRVESLTDEQLDILITRLQKAKG